MKLIVIGAGPTGIEAGLAASHAGHDVIVLEAGEVGASVLQWKDVSLFTPWIMNTTELGRQIVGDPILQDPSTCPTGQDYVRRYLEPLAHTLDVRCHHRVIHVGRPHHGKQAPLGRPTRAEHGFTLLADTPEGEVHLTADGILDCSGVYSDPSPAGAGGVPAPGERTAARAGHVTYGPEATDALVGQRVLVVGGGASGSTVVCQLVSQGNPTHWVSRAEVLPSFHAPDDDPLPARASLATRAAAAIKDGSVHAYTHTSVCHIQPNPTGLLVQLSNGDTLEVDHIRCCTGFRPDHRLHRELQVHLCWATEGPMKLAGALLASKGGGGDCLSGAVSGPDVLRNPEPQYFILGNKSYGRRSDFLLQVGHQQIQDVLTML